MDCYLTTNSLVDETGTRSCYIKKSVLQNWIKLADILQIIFNFNALLFLCLFYIFHRRYSNCRPLNSSRYNRIICQRVENTSFFERLSCISHALAKGYQGYKSNFGFHVPVDREIWQIQDQKSVLGFAERNTPLVSLGRAYTSNHRGVKSCVVRENSVYGVLKLLLSGFQKSMH